MSRRELLELPSLPPLEHLASEIQVVGLAGHVCTVSLAQFFEAGSQPSAHEVLKCIQDAVVDSTQLPVSQQRILLNDAWDTATLVCLLAPKLNFRLCADVQVERDNGGERRYTEKGNLFVTVMDDSASQPCMVFREPPRVSEFRTYKVHPKLQRATFFETGLLQLKLGRDLAEVAPARPVLQRMTSTQMPVHKEVPVVKWRYLYEAETRHRCPVQLECSVRSLPNSDADALCFCFSVSDQTIFDVDAISVQSWVPDQGTIANGGCTAGELQEVAGHAGPGEVNLRWVVTATDEDKGKMPATGRLEIKISREHIPKLRASRISSEVTCTTYDCDEVFGPNAPLRLARCHGQANADEDWTFGASSTISFQMSLDVHEIDGPALSQ
mmetsp:Transcript_60685/g.112589  ORF Transcript_60685/g.112589 Transcript_60685/m.112589 type:complete len:383 (+) Transcript_60685:61-1209(+)